MLGPCAILFGTPLAIGYSVMACVRAPDRGFAIAAVVLAALQAIALLGLLSMCFLL